MLASWKNSYDQPRQHIEKQRHYFANKGLSSQSYSFSSCHVWIWELDYKESWVLKNWCFWTVVLEKTLESPLDCKEIQPVHPKGDQSWVFNGRTDAEAETPTLWPPDAKSWLIWKDPDARKDWKREKGMTEDEMVGWHHRLNGHEFEQAPGIDEGQGSLACCSSRGRRVGHDWTTELNLQHKSTHLREGLWTFKGLQTWPALVQSTQQLCERGYCPWLLLLAFLQVKELKLREVQWSIKNNSHRSTNQGHYSHSSLSKSVHVLLLSTTRLLLLGHQQCLMRLVVLCPFCRWESWGPESQTT